MKLFKVSTVSVFHSYIKTKPLYAIAEDKQAASTYVESLLRGEYRIKSIACLGEQRSERLYSANKAKP